jgi:monoamine oxidase
VFIYNEVFMSHTPLFARLKSALALAVTSERSHTNTSETIERALETRWSRRQFLQVAGVSALAATHSSTINRFPMFQQTSTMPRIVIVGAGAAGLTCAYRLQQAGLSAQVIEAGNRVGGRMHSLRGVLPQGQLSELGGEFIDSDHESLLGLVNELGLTLSDLHSFGRDLQQDVFYFGGRSISLDEIVEEFRPIAQAINTDLERVTGDGDILYDQTNGGEAIDVSIAEWFDKHGVSGWIRDLLSVAYVGEYGREIDEQSVFNLLWLIGTEEGEFKIYGDSDERYHIVEGNDTVPRLLADALQTPIEFGTPLEAIKEASDGSYTLTFNQGGRVYDQKADLVVLTLPFTVLRQVDLQVEMPEIKRKAIDELGYGTNAKLMAGFSERTWQAAGSTGSVYTDLDFQSTWETTRGQAGTGGVITNYLGGKRGENVGEGTTETQVESFIKEFDTVFPGVAAQYTGQAYRAHWTGNPFMLGSYSCYLPGQTAGLRGAEGEVVGGLHFAGEHTSLDYQGYMNGACESGERVAAEIVERVKV